MECAYKYRIYPNKAQENLIQRTFGCSRFVYNYFLNRRIQAYQEDKSTLSYYSCCAELTQLKKELEWLQEVDSTALKTSLRDLDRSYQNFFRRVKKGGEAPGFPKFKSKKSGRKSFRSNGRSIWLTERSVRLPKLGEIRCKVSRPAQGRILSATVSQTPSGKYYVSLTCTDVEIPQVPSTGAVVGVDLGLRYLAYTSDGEKYATLEPMEKNLKALARAQRALSRKTIGSANWEKARHKVATIYERVANQRRDAQQKLTTALVRQYDVICAETLSVQQLQKQNPYLARQISDAGWADILRQIQYKCQWQHKTFVQVERTYPSTQLCSSCGYQNRSLKKHYKEIWECPQCGAIHDIDWNAAQNILAEGLQQLSAV